MKIGVVLPAAEEEEDEVPSWPAVRSFALAAEGLGLDSVWMFDHFFHKPRDGPVRGQLESWTVVSAIAAVTERVAVGTLVMCAGFRNPALLAKMAATADQVSGGRLILGLGAGWHDPEYDALGFPKDHRVDRLEEQLRILVPLLRGESVTFEGRYHRTREAVLAPAPSRHIPLLVAAFSPRMLRLTARHADAWNTAWYGAPDAQLRERCGGLDDALAAEGRDPATMTRTVGMTVRDPARDTPKDERDDSSFTGSVDELATAMDAYAAMGIDHLIVLPLPLTEASLERLASAIALRSDAP